MRRSVRELMMSASLFALVSGLTAARSALAQTTIAGTQTSVSLTTTTTGASITDSAVINGTTAVKVTDSNLTPNGIVNNGTLNAGERGLYLENSTVPLILNNDTISASTVGANGNGNVDVSVVGVVASNFIGATLLTNEVSGTISASANVAGANAQALAAGVLASESNGNFDFTVNNAGDIDVTSKVASNSGSGNAYANAVGVYLRSDSNIDSFSGNLINSGSSIEVLADATSNVSGNASANANAVGARVYSYGANSAGSNFTNDGAANVTANAAAGSNSVARSRASADGFVQTLEVPSSSGSGTATVTNGPNGVINVLASSSSTTTGNAGSTTEAESDARGILQGIYGAGLSTATVDSSGQLNVAAVSNATSTQNANVRASSNATGIDQSVSPNSWSVANILVQANVGSSGQVGANVVSTANAAGNGYSSYADANIRAIIEQTAHSDNANAQVQLTTAGALLGTATSNATSNNVSGTANAGANIRAGVVQEASGRNASVEANLQDDLMLQSTAFAEARRANADARIGNVILQETWLYNDSYGSSLSSANLTASGMISANAQATADGSVGGGTSANADANIWRGIVQEVSANEGNVAADANLSGGLSLNATATAQAEEAAANSFIGAVVLQSAEMSNGTGQYGNAEANFESSGPISANSNATATQIDSSGPFGARAIASIEEGISQRATAENSATGTIDLQDDVDLQSLATATSNQSLANAWANIGSIVRQYVDSNIYHGPSTANITTSGMISGLAWANANAIGNSSSDFATAWSNIDNGIWQEAGGGSPSATINLMGPIGLTSMADAVAANIASADAEVVSVVRQSASTTGSANVSSSLETSESISGTSVANATSGSFGTSNANAISGFAVNQSANSTGEGLVEVTANLQGAVYNNAMATATVGDGGVARASGRASGAVTQYAQSSNGSASANFVSGDALSSLAQATAQGGFGAISSANIGSVLNQSINTSGDEYADSATGNLMTSGLISGMASAYADDSPAGNGNADVIGEIGYGVYQYASSNIGPATAEANVLGGVQLYALSNAMANIFAFATARIDTAIEQQSYVSYDESLATSNLTTDEAVIATANAVATKVGGGGGYANAVAEISNGIYQEATGEPASATMNLQDDVLLSALATATPWYGNATANATIGNVIYQRANSADGDLGGADANLMSSGQVSALALSTAHDQGAGNLQVNARIGYGIFQEAQDTVATAEANLTGPVDMTAWATATDGNLLTQNSNAMASLGNLFRQDSFGEMNATGILMTSASLSGLAYANATAYSPGNGTAYADANANTAVFQTATTGSSEGEVANLYASLQGPVDLSAVASADGAQEANARAMLTGMLWQDSQSELGTALAFLYTDDAVTGNAIATGNGGGGTYPAYANAEIERGLSQMSLARDNAVVYGNLGAGLSLSASATTDNDAFTYAYSELGHLVWQTANANVDVGGSAATIGLDVTGLLYGYSSGVAVEENGTGGNAESTGRISHGLEQRAEANTLAQTTANIEGIELTALASGTALGGAGGGARIGMLAHQWANTTGPNGIAENDFTASGLLYGYAGGTAISYSNSLGYGAYSRGLIRDGLRQEAYGHELARADAWLDGGMSLNVSAISSGGDGTSGWEAVAGIGYDGADLSNANVGGMIRQDVATGVLPDVGEAYANLEASGLISGNAYAEATGMSNGEANAQASVKFGIFQNAYAGVYAQAHANIEDMEVTTNAVASAEGSVGAEAFSEIETLIHQEVSLTDAVEQDFSVRLDVSGVLDASSRSTATAVDGFANADSRIVGIEQMAMAGPNVNTSADIRMINNAGMSFETDASANATGSGNARAFSVVSGLRQTMDAEGSQALFGPALNIENYAPFTVTASSSATANTGDASAQSIAVAMEMTSPNYPLVGLFENQSLIQASAISTADSAGGTVNLEDASALALRIAGPSVTGDFDNYGDIIGWASSAGDENVTGNANAVGVLIDTNQMGTSFDNYGGTIGAYALGDNTTPSDAVAFAAVTSEHTGTGPNVSIFNNDGGVLWAEIGASRGTAVDLTDAGNPWRLLWQGLLGDGMIYGNVELSDDDDIVVANGRTRIDGQVNSSGTPNGSATIQSGGELVLGQNLDNGTGDDEGPSNMRLDSFTLDSGGTLLYEVDAANNDAGFVRANSVELYGDAVVVPLAGIYADVTTYDNVIVADGSGTGTAGPDGIAGFNSVSGINQLLTVTQVLDPGAPNFANVDLVMTRTPFGAAGRTQNQQAAGRGLESIYQNDPMGPYNMLLSQMFTLPSEAAVNNALNQLSGREYPQQLWGSRFWMDPFIAGMPGGGVGSNVLANTSQSATLGEVQFASKEPFVAPDSDSDRGQQTAAAAPRPLGDEAGSVWVRGYGEWGDHDGDPEGPGFDSDQYGVIVGADVMVTDTIKLGAAAGYSSGDLDFDSGADVDFDGYQLGVYGSYDDGTFYVDGAFGYGWYDNDSKRSLNIVDTRTVLKGDYDSEVLSVYGETGYRVPVESVFLTPFASLNYVYSQTDSFTESGGVGALSVDDSDSDSFRSTLGLSISGEIQADQDMIIVPEFYVGWEHEWADDESRVGMNFAGQPGSGFTVRSTDSSRDAGVVGLGVTVLSGEMFEFVVGYDGRLSSDYHEHSGSAGIRVKW